MKKLSIITICYNSKNLESTCNSIINQDFKDFEWIVIDGGSSPEIMKIWQKYKNYISKFISEHDNGVYDAMNKGIALSTGEYISFMNAGDAYSDKKVLKKVFENKKYIADILYGDLNTVRENKRKFQKQSHLLSKYFFLHSTLNHQSCFIKRELFQKFGLYSTQYRISSDFEKFIIFSKNNCSFQYVPVCICDFNLDGMSQKLENTHLVREEYAQIRNSYFSKEEQEKGQIEFETKYWHFKWYERIFSIKNTFDRKYKNIKILNINFKIRRKGK